MQVSRIMTTPLVALGNDWQGLLLTRSSHSQNHQLLLGQSCLLFLLHAVGVFAASDGQIHLVVFGKVNGR